MNKKTKSISTIPVSVTNNKIKVVEKALSNLNKIAETVYNTNNKTVLGVNISTCTSIKELCELDAIVKLAAKGYNDSVAEKINKKLIKSAPIWTEEGVDEEGILADIDIRLQVLNNEVDRAKLQKIMDGYKELLDKSDRLALLDEELKDYL